MIGDRRCHSKCATFARLPGGAQPLAKVASHPDVAQAHVCPVLTTRVLLLRAKRGRCGGVTADACPLLVPVHVPSDCAWRSWPRAGRAAWLGFPMGTRIPRTRCLCCRGGGAHRARTRWPGEQGGVELHGGFVPRSLSVKRETPLHGAFFTFSGQAVDRK
jgi:hypothetical protein